MSTFLIPHCSSSTQRCLVPSDLFLSKSVTFPFSPLIVLIALLILGHCKLGWTINVSHVTAHVVILNHSSTLLFSVPHLGFTVPFFCLFVFYLFTFSAVNLKIFHAVLRHFSHVQVFATPWTDSPPGSSVHGILQTGIL